LETLSWGLGAAEAAAAVWQKLPEHCADPSGPPQGFPVGCMGAGDGAG
jgi:hypothetical protein